ncbi:MAG TPA: acyltransferase [Xanthobacteraceae bacterium]
MIAPAIPDPTRAQGATAAAGEARVACLDGLRGLMTILVVLSHYFGEVPHGIRAFMVGWIAVDMFFVLSGYLVGKLILEKQHHDNFFIVFYVRRACRTLPIYFVSVVVIVTLIAVVRAPWIDADVQFPAWSYFAFTQNFFMVASNDIGAHWLSPTWTLAVEEHFYLIAPAVFFVVPRRRLAAVLVGGALAALATRAVINDAESINTMAALVLLPSRADVLICGLLAALAIKSEWVPWRRLDGALRVAPLVLIVCAGAVMLASGRHHIAAVIVPLLAASACAAFLLSLVRGAPEARRFRSRFLCFFGNTSYAVYLTHLPVLGLMHGLLLGTRPDLVSAPQWIVTLAALPVCVVVGWTLTRLVEEPLTRYGRTCAWSGRPRGAAKAPRRAQAPAVAGS